MTVICHQRSLLSLKMVVVTTLAEMFIKFRRERVDFSQMFYQLGKFSSLHVTVHDTKVGFVRCQEREALGKRLDEARK